MDQLQLWTLWTLANRPSCLDLRLYLLLMHLADDRGQVGTRKRPVGLRELARYLTAPGAGGRAGPAPTFQSIDRALARLQGVPGDVEQPTLIRVLSTMRGRGQIFEVEMGRGNLRVAPTAGRSAGHSAGQPRRLESRIDPAISEKLSTDAGRSAGRSAGLLPPSYVGGGGGPFPDPPRTLSEGLEKMKELRRLTPSRGGIK